MAGLKTVSRLNVISKHSSQFWVSSVCWPISHMHKSQHARLAVCHSSRCDTGHYTVTSQSGDALAPSDDSICTEIVGGLGHWLVSLGCIFWLVKIGKSPSDAWFSASITSSVQGGPKDSTLVSKNTKKKQFRNAYFGFRGCVYTLFSPKIGFFSLPLSAKLRHGVWKEATQTDCMNVCGCKWAI